MKNITKYRKRLLAIQGVLFFALSFSVNAAPKWMSSVSQRGESPLRRIEPTKLSYQLSWNGMLKSGELHLAFGKTDRRYPQAMICQAYGKSIGFAATLYPYTFDYTSFLDRQSYQPLTFFGKEEDRKEHKETTNHYTRDRVKSKEISVVKKGRVQSVVERVFPVHGVEDLMSAMLYVRSLSFEKGEEYWIVVHPFKTPYLIKVQGLGRERHLGRDAIRLGVGIQKIRPNLTLASYQKMKKATLWLSADNERVPLELRVKAFIGDVRATLVERKAL